MRFFNGRKMIDLYNGDCLEVMKSIPDGSVDCIITDPPYGNMNTDGGRRLGINGWDIPIEPTKVYEITNRILRKNGKLVLFSQEPYTTRLITEAIPNLPFSYRAIWEKDTFANALGVNKNMVSFYEDILVFSKTHQKHDFEGKHPLRAYFKKVRQYIPATTGEINKALDNVMSSHYFTNGAQFSIPVERDYDKLIQVFGIDKMEGFKPFSEIKVINKEYREDLMQRMNDENPSVFNLWEGNKYKSNILKYKKDYDGYHPTQKPVLLLEDLIKTYTNEGETVLDFTMGSGSTMIACLNTNRKGIGIELDKHYFDVASKRITDHQATLESGFLVGA